MKVWKLTNADGTTHGGTKWTIGEARTADGTGELCGSGWLHFYQHPLLAVLLNPIHADFREPRMFEAEAEGAFAFDRGLKAGCTQLTFVREVPLPTITTAQRVKFAKGCAKWAKLAAAGPQLLAADILAVLSRIAEEAVK